MPDDIKFEGEAMRIGGQTFVVPSLSVKQARTLWPQILELNKDIALETFPEKLDKALPIIHAALSRNYPALAIEDLGDMVDIRNFRAIMRAIAGQSGVLENRTGGDQPGAKVQ